MLSIHKLLMLQIVNVSFMDHNSTDAYTNFMESENVEFLSSFYPLKLGIRFQRNCISAHRQQLHSLGLYFVALAITF